MSSQGKLRIALAQTNPLNALVPLPQDTQPPSHPFSTLESNLIHARQQVELAVAQQSEIIVFPEYCMQGLVNDGRQVGS